MITASLESGGRVIHNVFALNGEDENSATFALGYAFEQSSHFLNEVFFKLLGLTEISSHVTINLQKHGADGGFTDIEVVTDSVHVIFEAKKNWELPSQSQLQRYAGRFSDKSKSNLFVTVSASDEAYALRNQVCEIARIKIKHISWNQLHEAVLKARKGASSLEEKLWLKQLSNHLNGYTTMNRASSNMVYVVSLKTNSINNETGYSWIDVVEEDSAYFHPVGNHWPVSPPHYIGFRYHGKLQSIYRINDFKVVRNLKAENSNWDTTNSDHFVYSLGKVIRPPYEIRSENIRSLRVWCALDTLLTGEYKTIREARDATQRRT